MGHDFFVPFGKSFQERAIVFFCLVIGFDLVICMNCILCVTIVNKEINRVFFHARVYAESLCAKMLRADGVRIIVHNHKHIATHSFSDLRRSSANNGHQTERRLSVNYGSKRVCSENGRERERDLAPNDNKSRFAC